MTLHSMSVELDKPDTVFETLENIFRPESNQTLSRFKFRGLKQCQSQSCDAYMAELCLNIVECKYPNTVQDELLKDQFIFGICVKEVQDHLLGEITPEDNSDKCLLEANVCVPCKYTVNGDCSCKYRPYGAKCLVYTSRVLLASAYNS